MPQRHYPKAFEFAFGPQSDDDEEEEDQNQNHFSFLVNHPPQFNFQISNKGVSSHISSDQNKAQSQSFFV